MKLDAVGVRSNSVWTVVRQFTIVTSNPMGGQYQTKDSVLDSNRSRLGVKSQPTKAVQCMLHHGGAPSPTMERQAGKREGRRAGTGGQKDKSVPESVQYEANMDCRRPEKGEVARHGQQ